MCLHLAALLAVVTATRPTNAPTLPPCSGEMEPGTACAWVAPVELPACSPSLAHGTPCAWSGYPIVVRSTATPRQMAIAILVSEPGPFPGRPEHLHVRRGYLAFTVEYGPDDCTVAGVYRETFEMHQGLGEPCWDSEPALP